MHFLLSLAHDLVGSVDHLIPLVLDRAQEGQPGPVLPVAVLYSVGVGLVFLVELSRGCILRQPLLHPHLLVIPGEMPSLEEIQAKLAAGHTLVWPGTVSPERKVNQDAGGPRCVHSGFPIP